ncbi:hypothetical protein J8I87_18065 [Paraburkholderia sp. LEh10]|jgi:hypothetical protein|uniref:hypothetical protein n=1 Tax=Paraburkholderia sp. LEh10 TaxID=2821353 RepID=UPI001AE55B3E|nr:hypothetical protein [Paraburkholderia sp. LEh10]MBP0591598.1 hypothetical protein [Paraburkholderia sp. LEh10]
MPKQFDGGNEPAPVCLAARSEADPIVTRVAARSPSTVVRASMRRMRDHFMRRNTRNRPFSAARAALPPGVCFIARLFAAVPAVTAVAFHHSLDPGFS